MDRTPLTETGAEALRDELKRLKKVERPRIVAAIEEARAHGDLKENAEYHAAKEEQGFNEGRIAEIEGKLASAQIIDVARAGAQANGRVVFGATLDLADEDTGEEFTYQIVGEDEADIKRGMLSFASPIARALIGKTEGDVVEVEVPSGQRTLEIVKVRYA
ncbi:transcription elongation factor GreA [Salinisphaera orenii MK-B5]|uniref:Transcription elongation factor GreA n=2 Tax=Salinisphaera orenii TaxID=856731 RepID=A0A423PRX4_9GAMM|nr:MULTISPECIES: transcription elongation factor GreA [Salinisphaera]ROO28355.1 transcription elongation factor GreA [Salinisphaera orenii MK-B5]ROO32457.1 transcription elongation factor GreA [Salinisphaera halophila YIM 95161]